MTTIYQMGPSWGYPGTTYNGTIQNFIWILFGRENLKNDTLYFLPNFINFNYKNVVVKDSGLQIDSDLDYKEELEKAVNKYQRKIN